MGNAPIRCRGIDFSNLLETGLRKTKRLDHIRGIGNCCTIVPNALMISRGLTAIIITGQIMGQINHKARITPRWPLGQTKRLDHRDRCGGFQFTDTPRRRQARKSPADDQEIYMAIILQCGMVRSLGQNFCPCRGSRVFGLARDLHGSEILVQRVGSWNFALTACDVLQQLFIYRLVQFRLFIFCQ